MAEEQSNGGAAAGPAEVEPAGIFGRYARDSGLSTDDVRGALEAFGELESANVNLSRGQVHAVFAGEGGPGAAANVLASAPIKMGEAGVDMEVEQMKARKPREPRKPRNKARGEDANGAAEPDPRSIYVRNVAEGISKAALEEGFAAFGPVQSVELRKRRLPRDAGTQMQAFVTFQEQSGADNAIAQSEAGPVVVAGVMPEEGKDLQLERRKTQSRRSRRGGARRRAGGNGDGEEAGGEPAAPKRKSAVYVSSVANDATEDVVRAALESFGVVTGVNLRQRESFASVGFGDAASADAAAAASEAKQLKLNDLELSAALWRPQRRNADDTIAHGVHVTGLGSYVPSEDEIRGVFAAVGGVATVSVRPTRTIAIIDFEDPDAAEAAVAAANAGQDLGLPPADSATPVVVELSEGQRNRRRSGRRSRKRRGDDAGGDAPAAAAE